MNQLTCDGCGLRHHFGRVPKRWRCSGCGRKHRLTKAERSYLLWHGSMIGFEEAA